MITVGARNKTFSIYNSLGNGYAWKSEHSTLSAYSCTQSQPKSD